MLNLIYVVPSARHGCLSGCTMYTAVRLYCWSMLSTISGKKVVSLSSHHPSYLNSKRSGGTVLICVLTSSILIAWDGKSDMTLENAVEVIRLTLSAALGDELKTVIVRERWYLGRVQPIRCIRRDAGSALMLYFPGYISASSIFLWKKLGGLTYGVGEIIRIRDDFSTLEFQQQFNEALQLVKPHCAAPSKAMNHFCVELFALPASRSWTDVVFEHTQATGSWYGSILR